MKLGLFYELPVPKPWDEDTERRIFHEALDQIELADKLGIDYVWEVEHHFLEEYSHSPAPEVFLGAVSQRTKNIRLGHGITLTPPAYNHPAAWWSGSPPSTSSPTAGSIGARARARP